MPGQLSVKIANLSDGGQLVCSNNIDVDYTQPDDAGSATLTLTTDPVRGAIVPPFYSVSDTAGTKQFSITFLAGTTMTGMTVTATITNSGGQVENPKTNISVACPQPPPLVPTPPAPPTRN